MCYNPHFMKDKDNYLIFRCAKLWFDVFIDCKYLYKMYTYTMEYYSVIRNNEIVSPAARGIGLENIIHGEINQTEKDKDYMISLTYGI